ncbi:MAG TPA: DUF4269 domain-containing protein [Kofleriaceae bacterium]
MLARLFRDLEPFQPTLIGTYPLGLQIGGSDVDIACACEDLDAFERALRTTLSDLGIVDARIERSPIPAVVAASDLGELAIEIFGQALPVAAQRGFRHMVIEGQLLVVGGAALAARVRELKLGGMKTEPAFARVLGLAGEPYEALLALETSSPDRLRHLVSRALCTDAPPAIARYTGDRAALLPLFYLADDSDQEIASYLDRGTVLVATDGGDLVGHVQMIEVDAPATWELKSVAVLRFSARSSAPRTRSRLEHGDRREPLEPVDPGPVVDPLDQVVQHWIGSRVDQLGHHRFAADHLEPSAGGDGGGGGADRGGRRQQAGADRDGPWRSHDQGRARDRAADRSRGVPRVPQRPRAPPRRCSGRGRRCTSRSRSCCS